jgi:6-phosphogluconolactonase
MIRIYDDYEAMSEAAAQLFVEQATRAVRERGWESEGARFTVALSGGHTPQRTYELLAQPPLSDRNPRQEVPWQQVHVFWGDERCVPLDDPQSNARMTREALLDHVPIPDAQVHPIRCAQDPEQAAEDYAADLRAHLGSQHFDLIFLGLGENGHTASLFPGTDVLEEQSRWTRAVYVAEQDMWRVTLTAPLINEAAVIAFLVTGASKAEVVHRVLEGPYQPQHLPAQLIQPVNGIVYYLLDAEAASKLDDRLKRASAQ